MDKTLPDAKSAAVLRAIFQFLLAALLGSLLATAFLAAPPIFALREVLELSSADAGTLAGAIFWRQDAVTGTTIALLAILSVLRSRSGAPLPRAAAVLLGLMAVLTLVEVLYLTPSIHAMRADIMGEYGGMEHAPEDVRGRFGMLHGISMLRALGVMLLGLAAWIVDRCRCG